MINMKKLQLRNVYGKPVNVGTSGGGVTKVNALPASANEGDIYYNTKTKEYSVFNDGNWRSITQEESFADKAPKVVNMGMYGNYSFLGKVPDKSVFPDIYDNLGYKVGAIINIPSDIASALDNTNGFSVGSFLYNVTELLYGELKDRLMTLLEEFVIDNGDPGDDPSRDWVSNWTNYIGAANIDKTFKASVLDCETVSTDFLHNGATGVIGMKYDVETHIIVTSCWAVGSSQEYNISNIRSDITIKILGREPIKENTLYHFPNRNVDIYFREYTITDSSFISTYSVNKLYVPYVNIIGTSVVIPNSNSMYSLFTGYPQKVGEYLCFDNSTNLVINVGALNELPGQTDTELTGVFECSDANDQFVIEDGFYNMSVLNPELEVGGVYEYHIHKASNMVNIIKIDLV